MTELVSLSLPKETEKWVKLATVENQPLESPHVDLCNIGSNIAHYRASNYYEAMLRFWSSNQAMYVLSTQMYTQTAGIAYELHKHSQAMSTAHTDAFNAWNELTSTFDNSIRIPAIIESGTWDQLQCHQTLTIMFQDGLTVSGMVYLDLDRSFSLGGLPPHTHVFIGDKGYWIGYDNKIYLTQAPDTGVPMSLTDLNINNQPNTNHLLDN